MNFECHSEAVQHSIDPIMTNLCRHETQGRNDQLLCYKLIDPWRHSERITFIPKTMRPWGTTSHTGCALDRGNGHEDRNDEMPMKWVEKGNDRGYLAHTEGHDSRIQDAWNAELGVGGNGFTNTVVEARLVFIHIIRAGRDQPNHRERERLTRTEVNVNDVCSLLVLSWTSLTSMVASRVLKIPAIGAVNANCAKMPCFPITVDKRIWWTRTNWIQMAWANGQVRKIWLETYVGQGVHNRTSHIVGEWCCGTHSSDIIFEASDDHRKVGNDALHHHLRIWITHKEQDFWGLIPVQ